MLIAKKSQRRFDKRRFRGGIGPDYTSALSEGTLFKDLCLNMAASGCNNCWNSAFKHISNTTCSYAVRNSTARTICASLSLNDITTENNCASYSRTFISVRHHARIQDTKCFHSLQLCCFYNYISKIMSEHSGADNFILTSM